MIVRIRACGIVLCSITKPCSRITCKRAQSTSASIKPTFPTLPRRNMAQNKDDAAGVPDIRVDHLVVGGGVVGLAVTRALAERFPEKSTYLVERHARPGEETSSRNSEVIHAGLYYPPASLKTNLCLRGRDLMYDFCQTHNVPHKQTGKLVVGSSSSKDYLEGLVKHVQSLQHPGDDNVGALLAGKREAPPLRIITGDEARKLEPDLGERVGWTLESPRTGIVDSHEFMATLERLALDSECAEIVYETSVIGIRPSSASSQSSAKRGEDGSLQGWIVETQTEGGEIDSILARHVINASGLNAPAMLNALAKDGHFGACSTEDLIPMWYSKGNYAAYSKAKGGVDNVGRLIYPLPDMGSSSDKHGHQGLGTHLTLDLNGNIRFGPDTDWLSPPPGEGEAADWWQKNLVALQPSEATQNKASEEQRLDAMFDSVTTFLPHIRREGMSADYAGIRPKLVGPGGGFMDFTVYCHSARHLADQTIRQDAFSLQAAKSNGRKDPRDALFTGDNTLAQPSLVSLCGIESPGLTSSLAIAEMVMHLIARRGWAAKLDARPVPKGAQNEETGYIDQWA